MGWTVIAPIRPTPGSGQNVTIGATSTQSTAFQSATQVIQISAVGGNCHVELGEAPTATATSLLVKASDPPLRLRVSQGATTEKLAVIQDGASTGTLNIVEITH